jgi:hypothetical protein
MPVKHIERFLHELDRVWKPIGKEKIQLHLIGSTALFLSTDYDRGTKDTDILETSEITGVVSQQLEALAGKRSLLSREFRMYIDVVKQGLPFLPQTPIFHEVAIPTGLKNFLIRTLDPVDVVVSKLNPFRPQDVEDIQFLVNKKFVSHENLLERFKLAIDYYSIDARAEDLPIYIRHLNQVERNMFFVPESKIDLPDWI